MMDAAKPEQSEFDSVGPAPASAIEDVGSGRRKPNRILSHSTDF